MALLGEARREAQDRRLPDQDVAKLLQLAVKRSGVTKSDIVNEALSRLLDPPPENDPREDVLRRLDRMTKGIGASIEMWRSWQRPSRSTFASSS